MSRLGDDYFDTGGMAERQAAIWVLATRRQLERWEPLVIAHVEGIVTKQPIDRALIWQGEVEHHFLLIALANLIRAVDVAKLMSIDKAFRDEVKGTRDLLEHWPDNMPIFNATPRRMAPSHQSGKDYAARHPRGGPYAWWAFSQDGAMVTRALSIGVVRSLLDEVVAAILARHSDLKTELRPPK